MNETNPKPRRALRGKDALEEATRFLREMRITDAEGAFAAGQRVSVLVDPRWNEDEETLSVSVTCHGHGRQKVDWEGFPLFLRPSGGGGTLSMRFLDPQGQAVFPSLAPGEYRIATSSLFGVSEETLSFPLRTSGAAAAAKEDLVLVSQLHVYESVDGRIRAAVRLARTGKVVVAVETSDPALGGAEVLFAFVEESSDAVAHSGQVKLDPVEGEGLWEGRYEGTVQVTNPCRFVFISVAPG